MKKILSFCIILCVLLSLSIHCAAARSDLSRISLTNISCTFDPDASLKQLNEGSVGALRISATVTAPDNIKRVLIAVWGNNLSEISDEDLSGIILDMSERWKFDIDANTTLPYDINTSCPIYPDDMGTDLDVLLLGLDADSNIAGYAFVNASVPDLADGPVRSDVIIGSTTASSAPSIPSTPHSEAGMASGISVLLNNAPIAFDVPPVIENGRTLVPLRAIFEALGAEVQWDNYTQSVTATKDKTQISLKIGSGIMYVNDKIKTLDVPAKLISDRTMVPARAVSEAFGCSVDWDDSTQTVIITQ